MQNPKNVASNSTIWPCATAGVLEADSDQIQLQTIGFWLEQLEAKREEDSAVSVVNIADAEKRLHHI